MIARLALVLARRVHVERTAEVARLDAEFDALYDESQQRTAAHEAERARIEALPDRCFVKPFPADCKVPP